MTGPTTAPVAPGTARPPWFSLHTLRRRQIVLLAAFTIVVEVLNTLELVPSVRIGALDLSLATIPAFGLAVACGARLLGRSSHRWFAVAYWILVAGALPALLVAFLRQGDGGLWVSYVVAAFGEEFIYRLAIPMVLALILHQAGMRLAWARPSAFAIAALWFVLLPGHRDQMTHVSSAAPFIAYAVLAAVVVYRSGAVLPMGAAHAVSNLLTALLWSGSTTENQRAVSLVVVLVALLVAYGRPRRLTITDGGELLDTTTGLSVRSLDLRDGEPVTATLTDGSVIVVEGDVGPLSAALRRSTRNVASDSETAA
ncbi:MAG: hypothetical protein KF906_06140 [Actinobacteria bacterium]|nr:hypothetical protein [Actinomycetota bacterium]